MKTLYNSPEAELIKLDLDEEILDVETGASPGGEQYIVEEDP